MLLNIMCFAGLLFGFQNRYLVNNSLTNERSLSSLLFQLDSLIANEEATDQQIFLRAMIGLERGQTSYSLDLLRTIEGRQGEAGSAARTELSRWTRGDTFDARVAFVTDSVTEDSFIRHVRVFTHDQIEIPYNPLYTEVALERAWTIDSSIPGNMFYVDLIPAEKETGGYSVFYFVPSSRGTWVHIKIFGAFSGIVPALPDFYGKSCTYEIMFKENGVYTALPDSEFLLSVIVQKAGESLKNFDTGNFNFESAESAYSYFCDNLDITDIPLSLSFFKSRKAEDIFRQKRATPFETALLLMKTIAGVENIEIYAVKPRIFTYLTDAQSISAFDKILLRLNDTLWLDADLVSPFGHLPGNYQNALAIDLSSGDLTMTPWLEPGKSSCFVEQKIHTGNTGASYSIELSLTGDFFRLASNDPDFSEKIRSQILAMGPDVSIDKFSVEKTLTSINFSASFSGRVFSYTDNYFAVYLYKPSALLSMLRPSPSERSILFPFAAEVIQRTEISGEYLPMTPNAAGKETSFSRASLEISSSAGSVALLSSAVFWGERISSESYPALEEFTRFVHEDVFPEFLVFERN
ncbi:hypothetical protein JXL83_04165 [candidate division WOR-3 bacterium]|nr:hypothetical protein [candidate division WOR-3 bacterium]